MIEDLQKYNNEINELSKIDYTRYENIFQVAKEDKFFFYNLLKKVNIPENLDSRFFTEVIIDIVAPYTTISNRYYGTQDLWWLICITNNITNPVPVMKPGTKLKILNPDIVNRVLSEINNQLKN